MGRGQATPEAENPGDGRSDFETAEVAVARVIASARDAVSAQNRLVPSIISAGYALRARRWWSLTPFLPLPESEYTRWRLFTAYGSRRQRPSFSDIAKFALWRQGIRRLVEMGSR